MKKERNMKLLGDKRMSYHTVGVYKHDMKNSTIKNRNGNFVYMWTKLNCKDRSDTSRLFNK